MSSWEQSAILERQGLWCVTKQERLSQGPAEGCMVVSLRGRATVGTFIQLPRCSLSWPGHLSGRSEVQELGGCLETQRKLFMSSHETTLRGTETVQLGEGEGSSLHN